MCSAGIPTPLPELETQICELAAHLNAATCRWLTLVAEYDARGGWAEWGVKSCAHWLSWRLGIGARASREHVRTARALQALPLVQETFARGELSYSKVRAITRVANPETEQDLVNLARHATGAQIEKLVRGYAGVISATREHAQALEQRQRLDCHWDDQGMLQIEGRLSPEAGAAFLAALETTEVPDSEASPSAKRAEALVTMASGEARDCELVLHVDAESMRSDRVRDRCELEHGPTVAPESARRLSCDAAMVPIVEQDGTPLSSGRRTRVVSRALRRALRSRDGGCRFPSCTNTKFLHAHHIKHWARGGTTDLGNLIQLCTHHHKLVHEGGYDVKVDKFGLPRFYNPYGWEIPACGPPVRTVGPSLRTRNRKAGLTLGPNSCRPLSAGDRLDYGIAVEGLARKWLPPPDTG
ncbi:MAG: DUF222 domain-containing protein [Solirubrobacterales bacterium]|nr:DUF222 domain-containing protein [Solirubrobacterales bacterium]